MLTFNGSNVLRSAFSANLPTRLANGWMQIRPDDVFGDLPDEQVPNKLVSLEGHVYRGVPMVGFMVHDFVNGNVGGLLSNFGGNFNHNYTKVIQIP
ncbi:MAG: hypothetical protein ABWY06_23125 [Pseudomonas sp.]|uniref:hypothetical protein n=1 Tax=Pseudomonas sp. TaxID=306 RepID=UPI00339AD871